MPRRRDDMIEIDRLIEMYGTAANWDIKRGELADKVMKALDVRYDGDEAWPRYRASVRVDVSARVKQAQSARTPDGLKRTYAVDAQHRRLRPQDCQAKHWVFIASQAQRVVENATLAHSVAKRQAKAQGVHIQPTLDLLFVFEEFGT